MANEHILFRETHLPISFTVADGTGIEKGTLLKGSDPNTAAAISATKQAIAGVAAYEKIANNGQTRLGVYRAGQFKAVASGSISFGDGLISDHTGNKLVSTSAQTGLSGSFIVGIALETATDGETFLYELRPQYTQGAAGA